MTSIFMGCSKGRKKLVYWNFVPHPSIVYREQNDIIMSIYHVNMYNIYFDVSDCEII